MSQRLFECKEEFPPNTDIVVKTAQVYSETCSNLAPLPGQRKFPEREVKNVVRPRKGHGY